MDNLQFLNAFNRAMASNGPWFSDDDSADVTHDIRAFCPEDWRDMVEAAGSVDDARAAIAKALGGLPRCADAPTPGRRCLVCGLSPCGCVKVSRRSRR